MRCRFEVAPTWSAPSRAQLYRLDHWKGHFRIVSGALGSFCIFDPNVRAKPDKSGQNRTLSLHDGTRPLPSQPLEFDAKERVVLPSPHRPLVHADRGRGSCGRFPAKKVKGGGELA